MWRDIKKVIYQHQHFVLTTHANPDGDGIGAASALSELLIQMGKHVRFVCDSPIPDKYKFLDYHGTHEIYTPDSDFSRTEVLIVLDTNRTERIGRMKTLLENPKITSICIDHHVLEKPFADHSAVDPDACSAGAMVYTLFKECGFDLDLLAATGIYTSIICDTGRFSYSSTSCKAHKIADECIKLGVDPDQMYSRLFQHVPLAQVKIFARALQRMETYLSNRVLIQMILNEDYQLLEGESIDPEQIDFDYILEFDKWIEEVDCVVLLRELPSNQVRISMRSKGELDVSIMMKQLGGGGHRKAAGATCKGEVEEVKEQLLGMLHNQLNVKSMKPR